MIDKVKKLDEIVEKYKYRLSAQDLIDILIAGQSIYSQGTGLTYPFVDNRIKNTYKKSFIDE